MTAHAWPLTTDTTPDAGNGWLDTADNPLSTVATARETADEIRETTQASRDANNRLRDTAGGLLDADPGCRGARWHAQMDDGVWIRVLSAER